jgi:sarcosine oxidase subunit gamma
MNNAWMQESPAASRFILQGDATARAAAAAIWQVPFSETACRANATGARATLWLGPQEYLLWESPRPTGDETLAELTTALRSTPCSLVDVSHRQVGWELLGPWAEIILAGACPLDLDPAHFPVGMCTRTLLAKADIVLWRRDAERFYLETWRSFAPYVVSLLSEIASGYDLL